MKRLIAVCLFSALNVDAFAETAETNLKHCLVSALASYPLGYLQADDLISDVVVQCQELQRAYEEHLLMTLRNYHLRPYAHARTVVGVYASRTALSVANATLNP